MAKINNSELFTEKERAAIEGVATATKNLIEAIKVAEKNCPWFAEIAKEAVNGKNKA